jgi:hypothetical protein
MMEDEHLPATSANADDIEAIMALGVFEQLCASSAFTAEACEVTQSGLLYCLWCFLNTHLIKDGVASQDMCETILFTERFLHGQANPS